MFGFHPTRTSPPPKRVKPAAYAVRNALEDISRSSTISVPELTNLTREDVTILDAIIERAAPSATTFLSVFKAYNDVLQEHGLDPHEVVYYQKLLKLGTLKGKNWGEKWNMVKLQCGYASSPHYPDRWKKKLEAPKKMVPSSSTQGSSTHNYHPTPALRENDSFTLHSHQDDTDFCQSDVVDDTEPQATQPYRNQWPFSHRRRSATSATASSRLDSGPPAHRTRPVSPILQQNPTTFDSNLSEDDAEASSTIPPSYRAATHDPPHRPTSFPFSRKRSKTDHPLPLSDLTPSAAHQAVAQARKRRKSVINEDEAWNKIQMLRDEQEADKFRERVLVERCWDLWRQGVHWIHTTNEQVGRARDIHLTRLAIQHWRETTASRRVVYQRVAALADTRCLKAYLSRWKHRLGVKKQMEWRDAMRGKMKILRETRQVQLKKDAWAKWRQLYQSHLSGQHYTGRLVFRYFQRWKERLYEVDHMEAAADAFLHATARGKAEKCWNDWQRTMELRVIERTISERVDLRVMGNVLKVWRKRNYDNHAAGAYYEFLLKKHTMRSWKTARDRIRNMERRADKHIARQDDVLVRAVARVWRARERGQLLERVKTVRLVKDAWATWVGRMQLQARQEDVALAFSLRSNTQFLSTALGTWRQVLATHRNAYSFAVRYYSAQLQFKQLLVWRIQLRAKLKMVKQARNIEKFSVVKNAWRVWTRKVDEKKREKKLRESQRQKLRKLFEAWFQRTQQAVQCKQAEQIVRRRLTRGILKSSLNRWTNRVIELKLRELEVAQTNEILTLSLAFKKWKAVCIRHVEELSLMESYQYVKREESIRRMFHHWLAASRVSRHRRITLQQKEDEVKRGRVAVAWDKWRDRFNDEKLRPIECDVLIQSQNILLFRTFGIWRSKTKSLPAIRFHASNLKTKFWQNWRESMPRALQLKEAREMDRRSTLARVLDKWVQTYRTKIALKAVARARYLRLPAATRPTTPSRPTLPPLTNASKGVFSRKAAIEENLRKLEVGSSQSRESRPNSVRTGVEAPLAPRPRSEASPPHQREYPNYKKHDHNQARSESSYGVPRPRRNSNSSTRLPSSTGGDPSGRSRLWLELQEVQRKSRAPIVHSRSSKWEPP